MQPRSRSSPCRNPAPLQVRQREFVLALSLAFAAAGAGAHDGDRKDGIRSDSDKSVDAAFDIVRTSIAAEGNQAVFRISVSGKAGAIKPTKSGKLGGSTVFSYVWPTTIDPAVVGFEPKSGILAFAVTAHPDFDDTPLFDENGDGDLKNDGDVWHSHWVVLTKDDACGKDALKVVDIPEGAKPRLPKTWPGLPIYIDSPGWSPKFGDTMLEVRVPFDDIGIVQAAGFDGVAAALRVNATVHSPLLCVADVFKIASGDLSLPGKIGP